MAASSATYAAGRRKPPLRPTKGQSGNPSGKPGLAKQCFRRALSAPEGGTEELELAEPANGRIAMARRMALDAGRGRGPALWLVLSLPDADCREDEAQRVREVTDVSSLLQGRKQGNRKIFGPFRRQRKPGLEDRRKEPQRRRELQLRENARQCSSASLRLCGSTTPFFPAAGKKAGKNKTFRDSRWLAFPVFRQTAQRMNVVARVARSHRQ
jgi:hypothetical protein